MESGILRLTVRSRHSHGINLFSSQKLAGSDSECDEKLVLYHAADIEFTLLLLRYHQRNITTGETLTISAFQLIDFCVEADYNVRV
jgi:hypothetical protein